MKSQTLVEGSRPDDRFGYLFNLIGDSVVEFELIEGEPIVRTVNPAFEDVFGYHSDDIVGNSLNEYIVPEDCSDESTRFDERTESGKYNEGEVTRLTATGSREFLYRGVPYEHQGERYGFAIYTDITDRKVREQKLQQQNEQLEEFANMVSHDLRNPINVLKLQFERIKREGCSAGSFETIDETLERMESMIEEFLAEARGERTVRERTEYRLETLCQRAWDGVETGGATLVVSTERSVECDPHKLLRVFENLFRNSVEHSSGCHEADTHQTTHSGSDDVTIVVGDLDDGFFVEDDGPGIPAEERDRVFEKGYTTTRDGTGFGLPMVQQIIEAHGWNLTLREGEAGGTLFEIRGCRTD